MPYCLYVRKSRADAEAEARGEGETLTRHINTLLDLARRRHLEIGTIHREIVSGETIAARPVMQQLLTEVEDGLWEGVLVMEVERLARGDTIDQGIVAQTFKYSNTKIITPMKDYDPNDEFDEEYFEFGLFMSRREYKTINRRLQRGRIASANEGKYVGNIAPYGYRRVKLEKDKGYTLEPEPQEAEAVKMMFELYVNGEAQEDGSMRTLGVVLISKRLNKLKIPPRKNKLWTAASVRDILSNPVYIGKIRWNWRKSEKRMIDGKLTVSRPKADPSTWLLTEGLHPAIIDKELFNAAQQITTSNKRLPMNPDKTVQNPLAGLVECGKCGRKMVRRSYSNGFPDSLMCPYNTCSNVSSSLDIVETHVLKFLQEWVDEYKLQWKAEEKNRGTKRMLAAKTKTLTHIDEELTLLRKQLDNVYDLLEQGVYDTEIFSQRSKALKDRIKTAEEEKNRLQTELETERKCEEERKNIIPKVEHLLAVYDTLPNAKEKNNILKEVVEKIVYTKEEKARKVRQPRKSRSKKVINEERKTEWIVSPEDFELVLFPALPTDKQYN